MLLAAFACPETERLGRLLGSPVAVIAATADPVAHARRLSDTWHAAWSPRERWFDAFDCGLVTPQALAYAHRPFDVRWLGGTPLPDGVLIEQGCFVVDVPRGCGPADLEPMFATTMAERRFQIVAGRPSSIRRRFATGRPLHLPSRYALSTPRDFGRVRLVDDLYAFRPRDLPVVAQAAAMAANGLSLRAALAARNEAAR